MVVSERKIRFLQTQDSKDEVLCRRKAFSGHGKERKKERLDFCRYKIQRRSIMMLESIFRTWVHEVCEVAENLGGVKKKRNERRRQMSLYRQ